MDHLELFERTPLQFQADNPESLRCVLLALAEQNSKLTECVTLMALTLGVSISTADNPAYATGSLSEVLASALRTAENYLPGNAAIGGLIKGMQIGSEPPEPNGGARENVVNLFKTVIAKAA